MTLALWLLSTSTLPGVRDTAAATAVGVIVYWVNRKLQRQPTQES
jgi:hypothetical protein